MAAWAWLDETLKANHRRTLVTVWVWAAGGGGMGAASTAAGDACVFAALRGVVVEGLMWCELSEPRRGEDACALAAVVCWACVCVGGG